MYKLQKTVKLILVKNFLELQLPVYLNYFQNIISKHQKRVQNTCIFEPKPLKTFSYFGDFRNKKSTLHLYVELYARINALCVHFFLIGKQTKKLINENVICIQR